MKTFTLLLAGITAFFFTGICRAQEEPVEQPAPEVAAPQAAAPAEANKEQKSAPEAKKHLEKPVIAQGNVQEVEGEVSALGKNSISIISAYDAASGTETEMLFTLDPAKIKTEHIRSFSRINIGDTVAVRYRDEAADYGDKQESVVKVVTIRFVKPADDKARYKKASAPGAGLVSEDLPLKGVKSDEK